MENERLEEIRGRWSAATEGPWEVNRDSRFDCGEPWTIWTALGPGYGYVANVAPYCPPYPGHSDYAQKTADAHFLAHSWQDIRDLLAEVERLRGRTFIEETKDWLKSDGFRIYCELKHGPIGEVLAMLADGTISRSRAAEAIGELMTGMEPRLPENRLSEFGEDELPGETVRGLRQEVRRLREDRERLKWFLTKEHSDFGAFCEWHGIQPCTSRHEATLDEWSEAIDAARGKEARRGE